MITIVLQVTVPVMVVHSAADEMMDLIHGQMLWDRLPEECQWEPWWLETEKHAHLPHDARQFFKRSGQWTAANFISDAAN